MKGVSKIYSAIINWYSWWIKQQQDEVLLRIKSNHTSQNKVKEQQLLEYYQTRFLKMQSQVLILPSKVLPSRLLNAELFEISSCEPRAEISVSHAHSTHSFPPARNWKTHPRDTDTCTSGSQLPRHSKPASSFPASSPPFSVFSTSTKEQTVSWARAAPNHMNLNTCQSYFHMKCRISHSCFHRLLSKAGVLSRTNTRSDQKNILK